MGEKALFAFFQLAQGKLHDPFRLFSAAADSDMRHAAHAGISRPEAYRRGALFGGNIVRFVRRELYTEGVKRCSHRQVKHPAFFLHVHTFRLYHRFGAAARGGREILPDKLV